ncbi:PIR Superfamily Protein [Plasmodium ovale wallikeri]|uniref:PIR Superfamily Protein n=1 Tax=Plasmodium ovale wallikeri TaxID=864142 RepID=A0A1A9AN17_PLAOA|nr:PIR Superfamily Protein [Plasmodium ovale wallikeri]
MTESITKNDLPSKKYQYELENGIHYKEAEQNMKGDRLTTKLEFWSKTLPDHLFDYFKNHISGWTEDNKKKRCRDLNYILDFILKRIKAKEKTNFPVSYKLIESYINNAAITHLKTWDDECIRDSKIHEYFDDIENMKNIDDLCEDIVYIEEKISKINSNDCSEIESYINQQISNLKSIYTTSETKYSHILRYYSFTSFKDFDSITEKLKSTCQEGATRALLTGDQSETSQYPGRNASIIAVTSLSGILSYFILLYKTTSFGSILNNLVGKKIKFGNNLSDEAYHETLEDISESSYDGGYNILYNSIGDS